MGQLSSNSVTPELHKSICVSYLIAYPEGPRTQIVGFFRSQIPFISQYSGPKTLSFGSLDPLGYA